MRRKLIVGNWKMNGALAVNESLLSAVLGGVPNTLMADVAVCVPFPYLSQVRELLGGSRIAWGAQNLSEHEKGAYTGEVSGPMLSEFGCGYVIVGHSERRAFYGDTNEIVAAKFRAAQSAGLVPILCVGETLAQREAGNTADVVTSQLDAVISAAGIDALVRAVVAYEPVWAIGTGRTATPDQAQEVHALIRGRLARGGEARADDIRILYGGSVKGSNARDLFAMKDVDGGLIGGASLVAEEFLGIVRAAD